MADCRSIAGLKMHFSLIGCGLFYVQTVKLKVQPPELCMFTCGFVLGTIRGLCLSPCCLFPLIPGVLTLLLTFPNAACCCTGRYSTALRSENILGLFGVHCNKCVVIEQFGELYSSSQFVLFAIKKICMPTKSMAALAVKSLNTALLHFILIL